MVTLYGLGISHGFGILHGLAMVKVGGKERNEGMASNITVRQGVVDGMRLDRGLDRIVVTLAKVIPGMAFNAQSSCRHPCCGQTMHYIECHTYALAVAGIVEKIWMVAEALWPFATVALASRG